MAKLNWETATPAQAQKMSDFLGENRSIARWKGLPTPAGNPTLVDQDKKRPPLMAKHDKRPGAEHDSEHWRWNKAKDGGARTDFDTYDWSGRQTDDHNDVRKKGSDR